MAHNNTTKARYFTAKHLNNGSFNPDALCPVCKANVLGKHPAVSRGGNQLLICSNCGTNEALIIFGLQKGWLKPEDVQTVKL